MNPKRPINLDLTTIHFPITAIASILHRISGILLFLYMPFMLWLLDQSLNSSAHFLNIQSHLSEPLMKGLIWVFFAALFYHLVAGIRHLLMDLHIGETLEAGRLGARLTMVISAILTLLIGVWLW